MLNFCGTGLLQIQIQVVLLVVNPMMIMRNPS